MPVCQKCKVDKGPLEFNKQSNRPSGLTKRCKACNKINNKDHYLKNKEVAKERKRKHMTKTRSFLLNYYMTHPCVDCGESDWRVLELDHIGAKTDRVSLLVHQGWGIESLHKEIMNCEVRCANCHRIKTYAEQGSYSDLLHLLNERIGGEL